MGQVLLNAQPVYRERSGSVYLGRSEDVLSSRGLAKLKGQVNLIFTSPPFPLNAKKRYGNLQGEAYVKWLAGYASLLSEYLAPDGSIVIELGNAWEPGTPLQSLLPYKAFLAFLEAGDLKLCQEITYFNPARLPTPAQWVAVERIRLKDSTSRIWWMAKTDRPKANNRNVLRPYSEDMKRLLVRGTYNHGKRPSEHLIGKTSFLQDNGGAIAPNLLTFSNTNANLEYQKFCKRHDLKPHPARMPDALPEFFINMLTDPSDLVLDPFAGSLTTCAAAKRLKRRWIGIEADEQYVGAGISRFDASTAETFLGLTSKK